jgi:hypothetical protein
VTLSFDDVGKFNVTERLPVWRGRYFPAVNMMAAHSRINASDFTDTRRDRFGLSARVMRVILDEAVDLPRRYTRRFGALASNNLGLLQAVNALETLKT